MGTTEDLGFTQTFTAMVDTDIFTYILHKTGVCSDNMCMVCTQNKG